jgi:hypothetical protein
MEFPAGYNLAIDATLRHVNSARPDAPVQPDRPGRQRQPRRLTQLARQLTAGTLRGLADRMDPQARPAAIRECAAN